MEIHRENGDTLGMVPLIVDPIYTLYSWYLLGVFPFKGLQQGVEQLGALHPKGFPTILPMRFIWGESFLKFWGCFLAELRKISTKKLHFYFQNKVAN